MKGYVIQPRSHRGQIAWRLSWILTYSFHLSIVKLFTKLLLCIKPEFGGGRTPCPALNFLVYGWLTFIVLLCIPGTVLDTGVDSGMACSHQVTILLLDEDGVSLVRRPQEGVGQGQAPQHSMSCSCALGKCVCVRGWGGGWSTAGASASDPSSA